MQNTIKFLFIALIAMSTACSDDENESTPLELDFEVVANGEAPNAEIEITNNSTGATSYEWTFSEGAEDSTSTVENPASISVDKAGEFTITLKGIKGPEEKEISKSVTIAGNSAIVEYSDIEFSLSAEDETYGRFFSFTTGEIYTNSEITEENGKDMHLAFSSFGNTMYFFQSASDEDYNVPNATVTKVTNYQSEPAITTGEFDAMEDDAELSSLTIEETGDSFGNSSIPGTVLFELANGRKGVIKTKAVNSDRLLVDVKIQKY